jgi:hypothetical protein
VIVDDPHEIYPVHALEFKGKDINLPQGIGYLPLEPPGLLGPGF